MAVNTKDVRNALQQRAQNAPANAQRSPEATVREYLARMAPEIRRALPKHMDADRLARIAMTTIRTTPKLLECSLPSLMGAVMQAAQLGLEPGLLGHCYIVPYGKEAQFIIGYRGMIDLARRSGNIESIQVHEVYENDYLEMEYGLQDTLRHIPWHLRSDERQTEPGGIRGAYMVARFKDGGHYIHYMPIQEIYQHKKRSKAAGNGPWVTDEIEMIKKTVVRSGWKWLPISVEIMRAVESADETVKADVEGDDDLIVDSTATVVDDHQTADDAPQQPAAADSGLPGMSA